MESEVFVADEGLMYLKRPEGELNSQGRRPIKQGETCHRAEGSISEPNNNESNEIGPTQRCGTTFTRRTCCLLTT